MTKHRNVTVAGIESGVWGELLTAIATEHTDGDPVAALRELFRSLPVGMAMRATNYRYTDSEGVMHAVNNGVDFKLVRGDGVNATYGPMCEQFDVYDMNGKVADTEKYVSRQDDRPLENAYVVIGHQAGAMGNRIAGWALDIRNEEAVAKREARASTTSTKSTLAELQAENAKLSQTLTATQDMMAAIAAKLGIEVS